nr:hypothetical protein [Ottowia sp. GY511]
MQLRTRSDPPRVSAYRIKVLGICAAFAGSSCHSRPAIGQHGPSLGGYLPGGLQGHGRIVAGLTLTVVEQLAAAVDDAQPIQLMGQLAHRSTEPLHRRIVVVLCDEARVRVAHLVLAFVALIDAAL